MFDGIEDHMAAVFHAPNTWSATLMKTGSEWV
jgi:hypothetical protein